MSMTVSTATTSHPKTPELVGGVSIEQLIANTAMSQDISDQISRLEKLIAPVLAPDTLNDAVPPQPQHGPAGSGLAECALHERLFSDGIRLASLRNRLANICERVRL